MAKERYFQEAKQKQSYNRITRWLRIRICASTADNAVEALIAD
jgi:hypothetical protein